MRQIRIRRGLDVPLAGEPEQRIHPGPSIAHAAVLGGDLVGLRPSVLVEEGDRVRLGQPLVADRREPRWRLAAPGSGQVTAIHRGARRALLSVVVALDGREEAPRFPSETPRTLAALAPETLTERLVESGLWGALRARPYGRPAVPGSRPRSVFVTAIDTNPLAGRPEVVIAEHPEAFGAGLRALTRLTDGPVFVCAAPRVALPVPDAERIHPVAFAGPHPAGLPGTHIHFLDPVDRGTDASAGGRGDGSGVVWYVGHPDVVAIGRLLLEGILPTERVVALGGPMVRRPRLVRTRLGASLTELLEGELVPGPSRIVSGPVLSGRHAVGPEQYLGRYHGQVSVVPERRFEPFRGERFSWSRAFPAGWRPGRRFSLSTARQGAPGPFLPVEAFERVIPLDVLPAPLLKALLIRDTEAARALGCLELEEEDLALATFVCPAKLDYGGALRACLEGIEREG